MHAILTLYGLIESGELAVRRDARGGGAGVEVRQLDGQTARDTVVTIGSK
jgi:hypothetical protein